MSRTGVLGHLLPFRVCWISSAKGRLSQHFSDENLFTVTALWFLPVGRAFTHQCCEYTYVPCFGFPSRESLQAGSVFSSHYKAQSFGNPSGLLIPVDKGEQPSQFMYKQKVYGEVSRAEGGFTGNSDMHAQGLK